MQMYLALLAAKAVAWRVARNYFFNVETFKKLWNSKWGKRAIIVTFIALIAATYVMCS